MYIMCDSVITDITVHVCHAGIIQLHRLGIGSVKYVCRYTSYCIVLYLIEYLK